MASNGHRWTIQTHSQRSGTFFVVDCRFAARTRRAATAARWRSSWSETGYLGPPIWPRSSHCGRL